MDQDLDLTSTDQQSKQLPIQSQSVQHQFSTDEIFNKLFEEKQMTWINVMEEVVEWIDLKYPTESDNKSLLEKFHSFNSLISSFYTDRK